MCAKVSVVIPVYNQLPLTVECLRGVVRSTGVEREIIVVDDGSTPPAEPVIRKTFPQVRVLRNDRNCGFAKTVNAGIRAATYDLVLLLNNDTVIESAEWLEKMVENLEVQELDLTAPAGGRMDRHWHYLEGEVTRAGQEFTYLAGWCLLVRRRVFDRIGLMPEDFGKGFFEDVLFSYRARRAGFSLGITENPGIWHLCHLTFRAEGYDLVREYQAKRSIFLGLIGERGGEERNGAD